MTGGPLTPNRKEKKTKHTKMNKNIIKEHKANTRQSKSHEASSILTDGLAAAQVMYRNVTD